MAIKPSPIARLMKPGSFLGAVSSLVSAGAVGQLVLIAVMPLVTRLYTPEEFGIAAVFGALLGLLLMVATLRYELAIGLPRNDGHAQLLVRLALMLAVATGVLVLALVAVARAPISAMLGVPEMAELLWLLPFAVVGAAGYRIFNFWALRQGSFGLIARTRVIQPIANAVTQVVAGFAGLGALGLAGGQAIGSVVGVASLSRNFRGWRVPAQREFKQIFLLSRRHSRFPRLDVPAALIDALSVQLPNLLLVILFNPIVAGWYLLADRAIVNPLSLVGQAVGQVIYARSREDIASGRLAAVITRIVAILSAGIILPGIAIIALAPMVFAFVFGAEWREAGLYASILFAGFAAQFVYSAISMALPATNGQHLNLAINIGLLIAKSIALYHGYLNESALTAIIGFSAVTFIGNFLAIGVVIAHVRRQPFVPTDAGLKET